MSIDWWTLGFQTVNVAILIWLLGHFFWKPVAAMIEAERAAGRAPQGVPAVALATMLRELNERLLERLTYTDGADAEALTDAVIAIWIGAIWGSTDITPTDQGPR